MTCDEALMVLLLMTEMPKGCKGLMVPYRFFLNSDFSYPHTQGFRQLKMDWLLVAINLVDTINCDITHAVNDSHQTLSPTQDTIPILIQ